MIVNRSKLVGLWFFTVLALLFSWACEEAQSTQKKKSSNKNSKGLADYVEIDTSIHDSGYFEFSIKSFTMQGTTIYDSRGEVLSVEFVVNSWRRFGKRRISVGVSVKR